MKFHRKLIATAALAALPFAAMAQTTGTTTGPITSPTTSNMYDRNVDQQNRIEQGLRSGDLNTQEASRLERQESGVDRMESRALRNGTVSPAESARINSAQNRVSQNITRDDQNTARGNPNSVSSQRMQGDVQRDINQQGRIDQGVRSGQLNNREAGRLENGQARVDRREANAGADGHIGRYEQRGIQGADNRQSRNIYGERHDGQFGRDRDYRRADGDRRGDQFRHDRDDRRGEQFRHDRDFRQAYGHDNGYHNGWQQQPHAFQQHSYAQAGTQQPRTFQQHSFAQAGGGRRAR